MEQIYNIGEDFYREIRCIEIYHANKINYIDQYNGVFPNPEDAMYKISITPESFKRGVSTKLRNGNYYTDIDTSFPIYELKKELRKQMGHRFNRKGFAIVLYANTEKIMLGNDREPLTVKFLDNIKDNNTGTDNCTITILGESILTPIAYSL